MLWRLRSQRVIIIIIITGHVPLQFSANMVYIIYKKRFAQFTMITHIPSSKCITVGKINYQKNL